MGYDGRTMQRLRRARRTRGSGLIVSDSADRLVRSSANWVTGAEYTP